MADNDSNEQREPNAGAANGSADGRKLALDRVYLKDLSFESPNSPTVFSATSAPAIEVSFGSSGRQVGDNKCEVVFKLNVTAKIAENTAFLVEVQQAGLFHMEGFSQEEVERLIGSFCPSLLYPYAVESAGSLSAKGGFPHLVLQPMNFDAMYERTLAERKKAAEQGE